MDEDFLDEVIRKRAETNPEFPALVDAAFRKRRLESAQAWSNLTEEEALSLAYEELHAARRERRGIQASEARASDAGGFREGEGVDGAGS
jgi:hypothetical protein